jgi:predicted secreted hydrolase
MRNSLGILLVLMVAVCCVAQTYQPALPGYHYEFPRDDFNHPEYQTEWWYYTGNLKSSSGHRFGFELTFFRQGVSRGAEKTTWQMNDLYMAHLALSDISGKHFYHTERVNRAGPGIAGIDQSTGLIWNGNWKAQLTSKQHLLHAMEDRFAINLALIAAKPPVIQGKDGVSQKAAGAGHASHYISITRLLTSGSIQLDGTTYQVEGTSWMDHEFFSEAMASNETGWDWLSVQLEDRTELMLYRLRHKDGSVDPYSSGTYIDAQGKSVYLSSSDFKMIPAGADWTSAKSKSSYPLKWQVAVPSIALQLEVTTPLSDQELAVKIGPTYWEGAIDVVGKRNATPERGVGYLEMTGYAR